MLPASLATANKSIMAKEIFIIVPPILSIFLLLFNSLLAAMRTNMIPLNAVIASVPLSNCSGDIFPAYLTTISINSIAAVIFNIVFPKTLAPLPSSLVAANIPVKAPRSITIPPIPFAHSSQERVAIFFITTDINHNETPIAIILIASFSICTSVGPQNLVTRMANVSMTPTSTAMIPTAFQAERISN